MEQEKKCSDLKAKTFEFEAGKPSHLLRNWVNSYSGYYEEVLYPVHRLEVPKGRVILIIGFEESLQISFINSNYSNYQAFVVGLNEKPLITKYNRVQCCIEIELFPWALNMLFDKAPEEFTQQVISLEDLWGNNAISLVEQLSQMSSWQERFSLIDKIFLEKLANSNSIIRPEIQWAWNLLEYYKGCIPIQQLAQTIGWSDRYLASCFRNQIGITPKVAARRIRFNHALQLLKASNPCTLSDIALTCGYSDQSHLTREFRLFSGCSPLVYQKAHFTNLLGIPSNIVD